MTTLTKRINNMTPRQWIGVMVAIVLVVAIVASGMVFVLASLDQTQSRGQAAQQAYLTGNYLTAVEEFSALIADNPRQTEWYIGRGLAYVALDNFEEAQSDFEVVLALEPNTDDERVLRQLGYIYAANDNPQEGIDLLTRLIDSERARAADYTARGVAYASLPEPDLEAALADLQQASDLPQTGVDNFFYLAEVQYELGDFSNALTNYQLFLDLGGIVTQDREARIAQLEATVDTPEAETTETSD